MTFEDLFHNLNQQTGQGAGAGAARPQRARKPRKAIGTPLTRTLLNLLVTLVVGAVYFYFALPALNPQDESFYGFLLLLCLVYMACAVVTSGFQGSGAKGYFGFVKKQCKIPALLLAAALVVCIVGALVSAVIFRAGDYAALLPIQNGDFANEVEEISFDQIPMLDKDSAERLGDRKLGELSDMVSQF